MDGERENVSVYVIKEGDNVDWIAETAGIPVGELLWANQIEYPYRLAVGQALYISDGEIGEGRRPLFSSGYAYPFIDTGNSPGGSYTHLVMHIRLFQGRRRSRRFRF